MVTIKTPEQYINQEGILKASGKLISKLGSNALIIGGKTALSVVRDDLFNSLDSAGIKFDTKEFQGYCTESEIEKFISITKELQADLIIGVGGGKVLDLVKAVGDKSKLPVVTVPTIAATCAAWSALSITYDDNGKFTGYIVLDTSPKLVLVDTTIIAKAPIRYLNAGIGDTLVKWYEAAPYSNELHDDISLRVGLQTAKLALDILKESVSLWKNDFDVNNITQEFREVVDSIIILAGLVGSINGGKHRAAVAHAIHNSLTAIPDTHGSLHGEKVAFGLIVQFILEKKPQQEIDELIALLSELNLPITLDQLGIKDDAANKISSVANGVNIAAEALDKLNFEVNSQLLEQAIIKVDQLGQRTRK